MSSSRKRKTKFLISNLLQPYIGVMDAKSSSGQISYPIKVVILVESSFMNVRFVSLT